uniref:Peptidase M23 n=1 Tax=Geobacter metallireducens TaxID=28232 RepID=A0A831UF07_GEOME
MKRSGLAAILVLVLLSVGGAWADVRDQLRGVKKEITEKKQLIKKTAKVEEKVSGELQAIDKSLKEKETQVVSLSRELQAVERSITRTEKEIDTVRGEVEQKKREIERRLVSVYKAGEIGNLRVFYSSESFPQMVENVRYMKSVIDKDRLLFADYNRKIAELSKLKGTLEADAARKERLKAGIEQKKLEIEGEKNRKAAYLQKVRKDKEAHQASLRELQANAGRLQAMVRKLEALSRKSYTSTARKPSSKGVPPGLPPIPDKGFGAQRGRLSLPVNGSVVSGFGRHKHPEFDSYTVSNGVSIAAPAGADIRAVYDGKVIFASYFKGYGNMVIIDHGGGFFSLYAHASRIAKRVGTEVARNETIASVGDVDSPRGNMLYFEIRYQGKPVDPAAWFR